MAAGASDTAIVAGLRLDGYELLCPLGEGGMASVWIARLLRKHGFEKLVAIKMILPKFAQDPTFQHMFLDEARLASRIDHVNVAHIHDLGERSGLLYLVMELIDGDALTRLRKGIAAAGDLFPIPVALRIMADVCAGLHAAHELADLEGTPLGVVHRDVSPQNVLISTEGVAKVIDFGVAKAVNRLGENTNTGYVKGKVQYMAPEQALAKGVDRRADVWAAGAVLFHLIAGRPPYEADNQLAMLHLLESGAPPTTPLPGHTPPAVAAVIRRALASAPGERFQTADAMRAAIERSGLTGTSSDVASCMKTYLGEAIARRRELLRAALRNAEAERASSSSPEEPPGHEASDTTIRLIPRASSPVLTVPIPQPGAAPNPRGAARTVAMADAPRAMLAPLETPDVASRSGIAGPYAPAPIESPDLGSRSGIAPVQAPRLSSPGFAPAAVTPPPAKSSGGGMAIAVAFGVLALGGGGFFFVSRALVKDEPVAPVASAPPAVASSVVAAAPPPSPPPPAAPAESATAVVASAGRHPSARVPPRASASNSSVISNATSNTNSNTNIERAREAAEQGDHVAVRRLLEAKVRHGQATAEEATLVLEACKATHDVACADEVRSKYPLSGRE